MSICYPDRQWCFLLADDLDAQLERLYRQCWVPRKLNGILELVLLFFTLVFVGTYALQPVIPDVDLNSVSDSEKITILTNFIFGLKTSERFMPLMMLATLIAALLCIVFRPIEMASKFYYRCWFIWGDGLKRFEEFQLLLRNIRWTLIGGFAVSVISSLIVAAIW